VSDGDTVWNGVTDPVFFDEVNERCPLNLDRLTMSVIQREHKVEKVALAKVARRLLLEVRSTQPVQSILHHLHACTS